MQKLLLIIYILFCGYFTTPIWSQNQVEGFVLNDKGTPLAGALVYSVETQNNSTVTDADGYFSIKSPKETKDYDLKVSLLGYLPQTKKVKDYPKKKIRFYLKEDPVNLDMVVVTGTRTPKLLKNSPIITKVITEDDIQKIDATHIGDLLQAELPGIEFSYSMNQQTSLNMQGFGGNAVLFLVDGERLAGETLDNIDYNRLNMDNVSRVEIIKGAASTLYGSNALGGVVNIITKSADKPWSINLNSHLDAYKSWRYGGSIGLKVGKFNSLTNIQHTTQDSYSMNSNPYITDDGETKVDTTTLYGNRTWNFKEKLEYHLNKNIELTGRLGYYFRERDSQPITKDRYRGFTGGFKGDYIINPKNTIEAGYSFDQFDKGKYNATTKNDIRNYSNVQHIFRGLYNHFFSKNMTLTLGGDFMRDYLVSYQFKDQGSYHQYVADIFAQFDWTPIEKFNIILGLRNDYFSEGNLSRITPKIGLMYRLQNFTFRSSYAGGFRAPTLKELYMNFDMASIFMIYGNTNLKPETSHNFTLSSEYTNRYYNLSVTGYFNRIDNRITTAWDQTLKGQVYTNNDQIDIMGIDINASIKLPCGIGARASYIYTHEAIKKEQPLIAVTRPHTATARIEYGNTWKNYGFNIMLNGRYLSKVKADEYTDITSYETTQRITYPSYTIWKLSLSQTILRGINLNMAIDNIFNYKPNKHSFNSPYTEGATFSAGISLNIDRLYK